jgi:hypothetical protein
MRRTMRGLCLLALLAGATACGERLDAGLDQSGSGALANTADPQDSEHYVQLTIGSRDEIARITRIASIDRLDGNQMKLYASAEQLALLSELGYRWQELEHPGKNPDAVMGMTTHGPIDWAAYPTYAEYVAMMQKWAHDYPHLCRLQSIGKTTNTKRPHDLWVMKITANPDAQEDKPEVFYSSSMHGDETTGYSEMLHLIDDLLTGYGGDADITRLVDGLEIWINPLANPDGTYSGGDTSVAKAIRAYVRADGSYAGVDPNRNFPELADSYPAQDSQRWRETQEMMDFMVAHHFTLSANFHGGSEVVNYPWDSRQATHADDAWFQMVAREFVTRAQADGPSGYMTDENNGITNGYAWYEVDGGRQDFTTYYLGNREVTIELSSTKNPPAKELPTYWRADRNALLAYLGSALTGVRGIVTDSSGRPVKARVEVVGHDVTADRSWVYADAKVGDYHRLLVPGTYTLRVSADGFRPQQLSNVVVQEGGEATRRDVVLQSAAAE